MHKDYKSVLLALDVDPFLLAIAEGAVELPMDRFEQPARDYGFPPVLIPLWSQSSGPIYWGLWFHPYRTRGLSFVRYSLEDGRATEIARNSRQLILLVAVEALSAATPDEDRICEFTTPFEDSLFETAERFVRIYGDDLLMLRELPDFHQDIPAACIDEGRGDPYDGDFVILDNWSARLRESDNCWPEVSERVWISKEAEVSSNAWLSRKPQQPVFEELLGKGEFKQAWMSLNSPSWEYGDLRDALEKFVASTEDPILQTLSMAWNSRPHERFGGF